MAYMGGEKLSLADACIKVGSIYTNELMVASLYAYENGEDNKVQITQRLSSVYFIETHAASGAAVTIRGPIDFVFVPIES